MIIDLKEHIKPTNPLRKTYLGTVVDNNDPKKIGRIKVTITGLLEGANDALPWVYRRSPVGSGKDASTGQFQVPKVGSKVEIVFPTDDIYSPFYSDARDDTSNQIADFSDGYPNTYGFIDDGFGYTYKKDTKELTIKHPSGTEIKIIEDGTTTITGAKDVNVEASGDVKVEAETIELDGSGGKAKLKGGKVALGADEELLDLFAQTLVELELALGNLGLPLSNKAQFTAIKTKLLTIKGNL
jgi:type VI secretion system secreted protein VgrG